MRKRISQQLKEAGLVFNTKENHMELSFQLCSRCKKGVNWGMSQLSHIQIGSKIHGSVCDSCVKIISEKVDGIMNEIQIPEALKPYLIRPVCPHCKEIDKHLERCPMLDANFAADYKLQHR